MPCPIYARRREAERCRGAEDGDVEARPREGLLSRSAPRWLPQRHAHLPSTKSVIAPARCKIDR